MPARAGRHVRAVRVRRAGGRERRARAAGGAPQRPAAALPARPAVQAVHRVQTDAFRSECELNVYSDNANSSWVHMATVRRPVGSNTRLIIEYYILCEVMF